MIKTCPNYDIEEMKLTWYMPYLGHEIRKVHYDYFHELFGHEGQNSILSYLRENDLGMGVTINTNEIIKQTTVFEMIISLTKKGIENQPMVVEAVFHYAKNLVAKGPQEYIFNEMLHNGTMKMKYDYICNPMQECIDVANRMHCIDPEDTPYLLKYKYIKD